MKKNTLLAILATFAAVAIAPVAKAAPLCTSGQSVQYFITTYGATGCTFGGGSNDLFTIAFTIPSASGAAFTQPGANANAIATNTAVNLSAVAQTQAIIDLAANSASKSWDSTANGFASLNYHYTITPKDASYGIFAYQLTIFNAYGTGGAFDAAVSGWKQINLANKQSVGTLTAANTFENLTSSASFVPVTGTIAVEDNLTLFTGVATGSVVGDTTHQGVIRNQLDFVQVPEPASMLLAGSALLGLGLVRRRRAA